VSGCGCHAIRTVVSARSFTAGRHGGRPVRVSPSSSAVMAPLTCTKMVTICDALHARHGRMCDAWRGRGSDM